MALLVTAQGMISCPTSSCFVTDLSSPACGAEADTSIIRKNGSPLGKTPSGGTVDAEAAVAKFMSNGATAAARLKRGLLDKLTGGALGGKSDAGGGDATGDAAGAATDAVGTKTPKGTTEDGVANAAGSGATSGLPTVGADGVISMTFHQLSLDTPIPQPPATTQS